MWNIRQAESTDIPTIIDLALTYKERVSPYVLDSRVVEAYLDEWLVAEWPDSEGIPWKDEPVLTSYTRVGGSLHYVTNHFTKWERNRAYLTHMKLVDTKIVDGFSREENAVFLSQLTCPGKGSFRALVDFLKGKYSVLYCWLSISTKSPIFYFYERELGLNFFSDKIYTFMNTYKGDWSNYKVGIWRRQ